MTVMVMEGYGGGTEGGGGREGDSEGKKYRRRKLMI